MSGARAWPVAIVVATALSGCGQGASAGHRPQPSGPSTAPKSAPAAPQSAPATPVPPQAIPTPGPTGIAPSSADVSVIRGWSDSLRRGDVTAAARYFALPSLMINGTDAGGTPVVTSIDSFQEAVRANASLPCGAKLLSADQRGRYVNALFQLTDRPGSGGGCGAGVGGLARTNFVISQGHIVHWIRAPNDPGDGSPGHGGPPGGSTNRPAV